ncbi:redoxin domain-containing protein [Actinoplanes sp. NBC_00393]|uniref:redoxin domain-containing protein n=1 Tax=Actinoplanes sp. NBC_00393 TaxID=2975953 RepID=UPI002E2285B6
MSAYRSCLSLLAAALLLTSCGSQPLESAAPASPAPVPSAASGEAPARQVPQVLTFRATTLEGTAFDGTSLAGRPVLFWFWAPWCPKCQAEGPAVAKTAERYADRVTVVGVAGLDKDRGQMAAFVDRTGTSALDHLDDRGGEIYRHFQVASQSSFVVVDADGETTTATGPLDEGELSALIDGHLR